MMRTSEMSASSLKVERLQTREATNSDYIDELAERMALGDLLPPIIVFSNGKESWLSDGIHRLDAAIKAKKKIAVEWRRGTRVDAVEYACGANASHGMRRTQADKRRSVRLALSEFPDRSSRAIAGMCCVHHDMVEKIRQGAQTAASTGGNASRSSAPRVGRDGKPRENKAKQPAKPAAEPSETERKQDTPPEPDSLEAVQADVGELVKMISACETAARKLLRLDGNDITRPWCSGYSVVGVLHPLQHARRNLKNDLPVGGTAKKPKLFHEQKAESIGK